MCCVTCDEQLLSLTCFHPLSRSLSLSAQRGSVVGGQAADVAHLHDGRLAAAALRGKDQAARDAK